LAKLYSHHYPGLLGRLRSRSSLQYNAEIISQSDLAYSKK